MNRNLAALADGERAAFDPVYRTLWPLLVRFIAGISGDRAIAEDMAQQAMLKIFSRVSTFDASRDGLSWSMTIAFNEYQSYRRRRANALGELDETALAEVPDCDTPEAIAIRDDLREAARSVLASLRPQDRETIVVAITDGQRPAVSAAAFRKRLQRALTQTRLAWKRYYG